jgi:predicted Rossmann fold flavoprotein
MMSRRKRIGIVGAGPSGIMAALVAARAGAHVLLFDTNAMVGRKLLVTGNGRCNVSNVNATAECYTCADREFLEIALARCGPQETLATLHDLGIPTYATPDGWCYPLSNSAATVAETFAAALELAGVEVHLKTKISDLDTNGDGPVPGTDGFVLVAGGPSHTYAVDRVIVATGGKAYPALGSKGSFFPIIERLGHAVAPIYPALAPILAEVKALHKLQGVRLDVGLNLFEEGQLLGKTVGNLMFTQYGLSGPAAMDLSHLISTRPNAQLTLSIDLLAYHRDALLELVSRMRSKAVPLHVILGAVLPVKIPRVLIPMAGLPTQVSLNEVSQEDMDRLLDTLTNLTVQATGTRGFRFAQLSTGGVPVTEMEPSTMASRLVPGLHFAGEVLDVVGPCGGYNLQFAFTSGALAGEGAAA